MWVSCYHFHWYHPKWTSVLSYLGHCWVFLFPWRFHQTCSQDIIQGFSSHWQWLLPPWGLASVSSLMAFSATAPFVDWHLHCSWRSKITPTSSSLPLLALCWEHSLPGQSWDALTTTTADYSNFHSSAHYSLLLLFTMAFSWIVYFVYTDLFKLCMSFM